jgi:replicative DNA helicase
VRTSANPDELVPLHSLEMEMSTLGSAMLTNDTAEAIRAILPSPEMFYRPSHQLMWQTCLELLDHGLPTEMEFVAERLGERINDHGGEPYLIQIAEYVPSPANGEYYAKEVLNHWVRRQYLKLAQSIDSETSPDELHIKAEAIKSACTLGKAAPVIARMGSLAGRETRGLSTGWKAIDNITSCGGFPIGQFCLARARTGVGKTPFLTQACISAAKQGRKPLYATFADLSHEELQERMMKFLTGWRPRTGKTQRSNS